jgi:ribonuclease P/MRP protein subunit POP5
VKRRYLALSIESPESFTQDTLADAIWNSVLKLYGEHGASLINFAIIRFEAQKKMTVVRTNHASVDMLKAALACLTMIGGKPAAVHVLRVSGTLKALSRKLNQRHDSS